MSYPSVGTHKCQIAHLTENPLPDLPPSASMFRVCLRKLYEATFPTYLHHQTKFFYRSHSMLLQEKYRMIQLKYVVVHPFSLLSIIREHVMLLAFLAMFFVAVLDISFDYHEWSCVRYSKIIYYVAAISNIAFSFMVGYVDGKAVVLNKKMIAKRYLKTWFIVDLIDGLPLMFIISFVFGLKKPDCAYFRLVHMMNIVRMRVLVQYATCVLYQIRVDRAYHSIVIACISIFFFLHLCTGTLYMMVRIKSNDADNYPGSYMEQSGFSKRSSLEKYLLIFHKLLCHFVKAGRGRYPVVIPVENIFYIVMLIVSTVFNLYIMVHIMNAARRYFSPLNKFHMLGEQLLDYMKSKRFSDSLQSKVMVYYNYRFRNKLFKESLIQSDLSEHLKYEILLHCSAHIISSMHIFKNLPKHVVGNIIAAVEPEIFLANDVLIKAGDSGGIIYFVAYGTLACYTSDGDEFTHVIDGDHVGCISQSMVNGYTSIAVECTEVLRWDQKDIERFRDIYPEVIYKLNNVSMQREDESKATRVKETDYPDMLRRGKILERRQRRMHPDN